MKNHVTLHQTYVNAVAQKSSNFKWYIVLGKWYISSEYKTSTENCRKLSKKLSVLCADANGK